MVGSGLGVGQTTGEEGTQTSGRLAGAQAKPEREAEHACPEELDETQSGTGNKDERIGLKDPRLQSKKELQFQPNKFSDFCFPYIQNLT